MVCPSVCENEQGFLGGETLTDGVRSPTHRAVVAFPTSIASLSSSRQSTSGSLAAYTIDVPGVLVGGEGVRPSW